MLYACPVVPVSGTEQLPLRGLITTASLPDTQEIRIIGFFFENWLRLQFEVRLLLFTVCEVKVNQSHYRPGVAQRVPGS